MERINRHILVIDLKCFFASCECVERGLDPFTTPLVVSSKRDGNGAITLAVTPYLKTTYGLPGRIRLYDIPKNIQYQIALPRMNLYIQKSKEVVNIFLDYVSSEDLHIYSIDECFLDVTDYLNYYHKTEDELASIILQDIEKRTGLTATCGIGPNMLLAKIAMDTEAKKHKNGIAHWTYADIPTKLWPIKPLSKVWGIGSHMEQKLNLLGINTIGDLAHYNPNILKEKYGVMGYELWCHANGIDNSIIKDFKKENEEKSFSHSQILFKDYYNDDILLIVKEMLEVLTIRLRASKQTTSLLGFGLGYSKNVGGGFYHSIKLDQETDLDSDLFPICKLLFTNYYEDNMPVRKISLSLGKLNKKKGLQLNLFENPEQSIKKEQINDAVDQVKLKYGKNSILKASSLLSTSTIKTRNQLIGGHHE